LVSTTIKRDVIRLENKIQKKFKINNAIYKISFSESLIIGIKSFGKTNRINYIDKALNEMLKLAKNNSE